MVDAVFNGILAGSATYVLYSISPDRYPFIFASSAMGVCHGLFGLNRNIIDGKSNNIAAEAVSTGDSISKLYDFTGSYMKYMVFPLVNICLYSGAKQSPFLGLGHSLFVIPLALDLSFKVFDINGDGDSTKTLKELTVLGSVMSLFFLAANEEKLPYGLMGLAAFCSRYAPPVMENIIENSEANTALLAYSVYFALIPWATEG